MIAAWAGYCVLISAILAVAALLTERSLGHYRKPVRWVWTGAIAGSLLLPALAYLIPWAFRDAGAPPSIELLPLQAVSGQAVARAAEPAAGFDLLGWLTSVNALFGAVWVGSIVLLGGYLSMTFGRLRGEMRSWMPGRILDAPVLVSPDRGPAVIGFRRSVIVLPRWIAELRDDVLRLVFLHEREHQLAGDQRLFALGVTGTLAMPWNPVMWWQLRRLRLAIEFDCDHRVIAGGVAAREYAEALLEVGSRVSRPPLATAAFAERRSAVERRIQRMTQPLGTLRGPRALVAAACAALLVGLACQSPVPPSLAVDTDETQRAKAVGVVDLTGPQLDDLSERPSFIPYDVPPRLMNAEETVQALRDEYPTDLRDAGVGGRVELWLYLDAEGSVLKSLVKTGSEEPALEEAAQAVAARMRFSPALNEDSPTDVWVSQWIAFEATADRVEREGGSVDAVGTESTQGPVGRLGLAPDPLIVIDGFVQPPGMTVKQIDRRNIENIEVIKGEAARGLYGDRAGEGVISITTKTGAGITDEELPPPPPPTVVTEVGREPTDAVTPEPVDAMAPELADVSEGPPRFSFRMEVDEPESADAVIESPPRFGFRTEVDRPELVVEPAQDGEMWEISEVAEALVVIDGVIQADLKTFRDMDPGDIDTIEILDGTSGIQVYGPRGARGVIRITTKKR